MNVFSVPGTCKMLYKNVKEYYFLTIKPEFALFGGKRMGDNCSLNFSNELLRKGTVSIAAATFRVSKDLCVYGHSMVRGPGNFPDLFTPPLQVCRLFSL